MPFKSKKLTVVVIILTTVTVILSLEFYLRTRKEVMKTGAYSRVKGNPKAPITVIEFVDFQCPSCAEGAKYLGKVMSEYPDQIRLELKYFPLQNHSHGLTSAKYAECVSQQGKFWEFTQSLFDTQAKWAQLPDARPTFEYIAEEYGLNIDQLGACLRNEATEELIMNNKTEGRALGIKSTPTYFINGNMVVGVKSLDLELGKLLKH
jgi:protein-disulfide isomerase